MKYIMRYNIIINSIFDYSDDLWKSLATENIYYEIHKTVFHNKEIWECVFCQIDDQENSNYVILNLLDIKKILYNFDHNYNTYNEETDKYYFEFEMTEEEMFYYALICSWWNNWINSGYIRKVT